MYVCVGKGYDGSGLRGVGRVPFFIQLQGAMAELGDDNRDFGLHL